MIVFANSRTIIGCCKYQLIQLCLFSDDSEAEKPAKQNKKVENNDEDVIEVSTNSNDEV